MDEKREVRLDRFSPARAGNSCDDARRRADPTVQPRACGELGSRWHGCARERGSAPRVRGTPRNRLQLRKSSRFSPARAGNSLMTGWEPFSGTVQPRACGELSAASKHKAATDGSAPRVRGTQKATSVAKTGTRFSPARAGNSLVRFARTLPRAVQPRACGELPGSRGRSGAGSGSAPRVRGTLGQIRCSR